MGNGSHDVSYRDCQEFVYPPTHHIAVMILAEDQGLRRRDFFSFFTGGKQNWSKQKKGDTCISENRNGNKRQEKCKLVDHFKTRLEISKVQHTESKI